MELQLGIVSADENFIYQHFNDGSVVKRMRQESNRPPVMVSRKTPAKNMGEEVEGLEQNSAHLEKRLLRLENRAVMKPEGIRERPEVDPEAEDLKWLADMEVLATGTYEEKKKVYQEREGSDLSPSEAKRKYRQEQEDDAWVEEMLAYGGQKE